MVKALLEACPEAAKTIAIDDLERIPVMHRFLALGPAAGAVTCRLLLQADPEAASRPQKTSLRLNPLQIAMQSSCNAEVIELLLAVDRDAAGRKESENRGPLPIFLSWVGATAKLKLVPSPLESIQAMHAACPAVCLPRAGAGALHCALEGWAPLQHIWWLLKVEPSAVRRATKPKPWGSDQRSDDGISGGPSNHPAGALPLHCAFHNRCASVWDDDSSVFWVASEEGMGELVTLIAALIAAYPDALHHPNSKGDTPLAIALRHCYPAKLVQLLCSETAASMRSSDGKLPLAQLLERGIASGPDGSADRQLLHELLRLHPAAVSAGGGMHGWEPLLPALCTKSGAHGQRVLINPVDVIALVISLILDVSDPAEIMRDNHALHRALLAGGLEAELVVKMLATPESVTKTNEFGECSLHVAAAHHCSTAVLRHLDALGRATGLTLASVATPTGLLPLHSALRATARDCEQVAVLAAMYPEALALSSHDGNTCLHLCVQRSTPIEVTRFILQKYPQATAKRNADGEVPFRVALRCSASLESVRLLLEADPRAISDPAEELFPMYTTVESLGHGKGRDMRYLRDLCMSDLAADIPDYQDMTRLPHKAMPLLQAEHRKPRQLHTSVVVQAPGQPPVCYSLKAEASAAQQAGSQSSNPAIRVSELYCKHQSRQLRTSVVIQAPNHYNFAADTLADQPYTHRSLVELYCKHYGQLNAERNSTSIECGCSFGDCDTVGGRIQVVRNASGLLSLFADSAVLDCNANIAWIKPSSNAQPDSSLAQVLADVTGLTLTKTGGHRANIRISGTSPEDYYSADGSPPVDPPLTHFSLTIECEDEAEVDAKLDQFRAIWQARGKANPLLHADTRGNNVLHALSKSLTSVVASLGTYIHCTCLLSPEAAAHKNRDGNTPFATLVSRPSATAAALQCLMWHYPEAVRGKDRQQLLCLHSLLREGGYSRSEANAELVIKTVVAAWPAAAAIPCAASGGFSGGEGSGLPLHMAIRNRKTRSCASAIFEAFPAAIDTPDPADGLYAVHMACARPSGYHHSNYSSDPKLLSFCLEADKMAATRTDSHGRIALCHVCQSRGNDRARDSARVAKCASMLISAYPDSVKRLWPTPDAHRALAPGTSSAMLPLHAAIIFGISPDTIQLLVEAFPAGCTIPCVDRDGSQRLPLELALGAGANVDVLRILCRAYKQAIFMPLSERSDYRFPLHAALAHGCDVAVITDLLSTAAEKQVGGATTHRFGVATGVYHSITKHGAEMARVPDHQGRLPLHISLTYNAKAASVLQVLQAYPEAVNVADSHGMLPVHIALMKEHAVQVVLPLIQASGPVAPDGNYGRSLLHWACRSNYERFLIEQLVQMDALGDKAASTPEKSGELPLHCLVSRSGRGSKSTALDLLKYLLDLNPAAVATPANGHGLCLPACLPACLRACLPVCVWVITTGILRRRYRRLMERVATHCTELWRQTSCKLSENC